VSQLISVCLSPSVQYITLRKVKFPMCWTTYNTMKMYGGVEV
jgi:hypothetical protein